MKVETSVLSLMTNVGTTLIILYLIKSAKQVIIRWMELQTQREVDLLGPTELRYRGGMLRPQRPIPLTTLHVPSAEVPTIPLQAGSTMWSSLTRMFLGAGPVNETR